MAENELETSDELFERILAGDPTAMEELLLRNHGWLEGYIRHKIPPHKRGLLNPEDVIQDVYLRVFRSLSSFRPEGRPQLFAWLKTIARNALFDALRRERRIPDMPESDIPDRGRASTQLTNVMEQLAIDDNPRASQFVRVDELHQAFRLALTTLPDDYRRAIELLYIEQRNIESVARELGKSVDAVRGIRTRARTQLREALVRLSHYV